MFLSLCVCVCLISLYKVSVNVFSVHCLFVVVIPLSVGVSCFVFKRVLPVRCVVFLYHVARCVFVCFL